MRSAPYLAGDGGLRSSAPDLQYSVNPETDKAPRSSLRVRRGKIWGNSEDETASPGREPPSINETPAMRVRQSGPHASRLIASSSSATTSDRVVAVAPFRSRAFRTR